MQAMPASGARTAWVAALPAVLFFASCATAEAGETIRTQAHGTTYFELEAPAVYTDPGGFRIVGRACRLGQTVLMSPEFVRIEHLSATGEVVHHAQAYLPEMLLRSYQRCSHYSATVAWKFQADENVNVCFERGKACPPSSLAQPAAAAP